MTVSERLVPSPQGDHTLIVIPTYNEMETLPDILTRVWAHVPHAHILIVDDSSPDGTGEWVDSRCKDEERLHVLHRPAKSGLATAYVDGMGWGIEQGYPFILQMDADGSHRPVDLPKLLARMAGPDKPDLVIGSRWVPGGAINGWSSKRVALSKAGNYYVRFCLGTPVKDATAGLRLHRSAFLAQHEVLGRVATTGFGFQVEMTELERSLGAVIAEVPITFDERMAGESKLDSSIFVEELVMVTKGGLSRVAQAARRILPKR
ncbi:polyprenol monophosphomannose synthase [Pauljensenia sp. UMB0018B]|uniref:Polyprenol monophosphomannose synthase n=1 Tax=Schaalia odontolytica TaxID=1660 RepID=A0A2I1I2U5_9ACTO|nr:polyprenol monophosphomannose synthase [Schaalia odontolytica]MDK7339135.1 polyprenol monophosphomannose synthase [Pauljensenia sp. UMB0018B]PKY65452.1 polyprenol monophosphomannose synthase [Schaalia odontolytica]